MSLENRRPVRINIGPMARTIKESGPEIPQDDPFSKLYKRAAARPVIYGTRASQKGMPSAPYLSTRL